ncbi:hypothetical protein KIN20_026117 [Parelaphostrongylus tenuis]|uniref:Uncharacterized protein n=1 Tax=Parelaphostrongylus tenuis TaxID=148309 RepID=A0AAD5N065_PARTN|nr:hypothetical protein KIN20_026117 [Parelaphostrongylus tenuis]
MSMSTSKILETSHVVALESVNPGAGGQCNSEFSVLYALVPSKSTPPDIGEELYLRVLPKTTSDVPGEQRFGPLLSGPAMSTSPRSHPPSRQRKTACRQADKEEADRTGLRVAGSSAVQP